MQTVTIKPKKEIKISVEGENISPDKFGGKTEKEIQSFVSWMGNQKTTLGELFSVKAEGSGPAADTKIVMEGDFSRVKRIGEGMTAGLIVINGNVDMHLGAKMSGGKISVKGNVDSWAGREMKGG